MALPRGIRNHNPGNIDRTGAAWQGMDPDQTGDSRFIVFIAPEWGIRAIARVLRTYRAKYGLDTPRGLINRWAPPRENDTDAYVRTVAAKLGVGPDDKIDLDDPLALRTLVKAIIRHENGPGPGGGDWYDDEMVDDGIARA